jgi:hypothetical protein
MAVYHARWNVGFTDERLVDARQKLAAVADKSFSTLAQQKEMSLKSAQGATKRPWSYRIHIT